MVDHEMTWKNDSLRIHLFLHFFLIQFARQKFLKTILGKQKIFTFADFVFFYKSHFG